VVYFILFLGVEKEEEKNSKTELILDCSLSEVTKQKEQKIKYILAELKQKIESSSSSFIKDVNHHCGL